MSDTTKFAIGDRIIFQKPTALEGLYTLGTGIILKQWLFCNLAIVLYEIGEWEASHCPLNLRYETGIYPVSKMAFELLELKSLEIIKQADEVVKIANENIAWLKKEK